MVRILTSGSQTPRSVQRSAFELACSLEGVKPTSLEAKERIDIRHSVGRLMSNKVRGRALPIHKSRGPRIDDRRRHSPNGHLFLGAYPRKVVTTKQKLRHLNNNLDAGYISMQVYVELRSVLE